MADENHADPNPTPNQQQKQNDDHQHDKEQQQSPPDSPPSKLPRISSNDSSSDPGAVTTAIASPFALGLGLGIGTVNTCASTTTMAEASKETSSSASTKAGFTFMQMQEFHHQALIFKHMVAGIPVPIHLILPIWKSVAASYGPHHYPSFVGLGNLCYDFRNSMEPEPGRCRRTDGKKWRCSRDVVPEHKYCERHMHRGRNRSRKPVEGAAAAATSPTGNIDDGNCRKENNNIDVSRRNVALTTAAAGRIESSPPVSVLGGSAAACACKRGAA